jgi:hypothetical protein
VTTAAVPPAQALLVAWESAVGAAPALRGAVVVDVLLGAGSDGTGALDLPLPRTAALAARCHTDLFGARVDGVLTCAGCGALMEVPVRLDELFEAVGSDPQPGGDVDSGSAAEPAVATGAAPGADLDPDREPDPDPGAGRVTPGVRCPTARDMVAVAAAPDGVVELIRRCAPGLDPHTLTPAEVRAVDRALEAVAAPALPVVRASCPDCALEVRAVVDAPALLWQRVEETVPRLLEDVARLAGAFGWSEADVLALGPRRRAAYLRLVAP